MTRRQKQSLFRIILSALLLILSIILKPHVDIAVTTVLSLLTYLLIGYEVLYDAVRGILNGRVLDENFLMATASIGAIVLAFCTKSGDFFEAIAVMLFYEIGELFESYAIGKSRKNISELMDIRPDYANIEADGELKKVDPDEVNVGDVIIVNPGEKIPIDGTVIEGSSSLDTAALTGESLVKDVSVGENVISGCINVSGVLKIRTTKPFGESTVSKILELVEESSSHKSKSEDFISKFARIYTPAVCIGALLLAVLPPVLNLIMGNDANFFEWIYQALTFLVISCPCALVISVPLSFFAGIGGASKEGILIKGSNYLETLSKTKTVVFDKTGTLTKGRFEVSKVNAVGASEEKLIEISALCEASSSHPIAQSLIKAYGKPIERERISNVEELGGFGINAVLDGKKVFVGNSKLMEKAGVLCQTPDEVGTAVHVATENEYLGYIVVSDVLKPNAKEAIEALKASGVEKTVMLTGDSAAVAKKVANELLIDSFKAELLPDGKVLAVEELLSKKKPSEKLAFVGDGINDAPVLARADIGIAMGAMGSDAAIEAADVVLMDDDPQKISKAIKISRKCLSIVNQNIVMALGIKLLCLLLGIFKVANMWFAIFADVGVMVIAVLNAIRALNVKKL